MVKVELKEIHKLARMGKQKENPVGHVRMEMVERGKRKLSFPGDSGHFVPRRYTLVRSS
jgi:hypothetical protein